MQVAEQDVLQHEPVSQKPLRHCDGLAQSAPFCSRPPLELLELLELLLLALLLLALLLLALELLLLVLELEVVLALLLEVALVELLLVLVVVDEEVVVLLAVELLLTPPPKPDEEELGPVPPPLPPAAYWGCGPGQPPNTADVTSPSAQSSTSRAGSAECVGVLEKIIRTSSRSRGR